MNKHIITIFLLSALLLSGCSKPRPRYVIGVSQCSADIWREKQNTELRLGAYFQENVELRFAAAYDSDERQVQQIDSLLATGIDLLIVAPNQLQTISPAIDRAYDSGIPVIVFERKTNSQKFTAFISADNYEMGRVMGDYIATQLDGRGRVVEVMGLKGSSPAIERHKGFAEALSHYPEMQIVATLQGDWTEESGRKAVEDWLQTDAGREAAARGIDCVFGQNDRMAMGARQVFTGNHTSHLSPLTSPLPRFCGIDGLPGEGGGIQLVRDSILDASYIYPTHGDRLIDLAVAILDGKPYDKELQLRSAIVTRDNANVLLMQGEEMMRQSERLDQLHRKADSYLQQLDTQRTVTLLAFGTIALLIVAIVLFYRYYIGQIALRRERVVNTLWALNPEDVEPHSLQNPAGANDPSAQRQEPASQPERTHSTDSEKPSDQSAEAERPEQSSAIIAELSATASQSQPSQVPQKEDSEPETTASTSFFITRFKEAVEARLDDSELSVEDLASDMHLSRVQLYRKVKAVTGSTPVELLRTARLKRGYQLLLTTDKSVSEVAYLVGFTAPSYFTKCFKEEYGQLPGDVRSS